MASSDESAVAKPIRVGMVMTNDPQTMQGLLGQFCLALAEATSCEVVPRGVTSYQQLLGELGRAEVDLVWLPPISALRAVSEQRVKPLALPVRSGESAYMAALFCRADAPFRTLDDLVGMRAAWVHDQSASGYLIIRAHLEREGVDLERAFSEHLFLRSHRSVVEAVLEGHADVGATFAYLDEAGKVLRAGWGPADVRILAQAGPVPNDLIAVRSDLGDALVGRLQKALVESKSAWLREAAKAVLGADGFITPTEAHLAPLSMLLSGLSEAGEHPQSLYPRSEYPRSENPRSS